MGSNRWRRDRAAATCTEDEGLLLFNFRSPSPTIASTAEGKEDKGSDGGGSRSNKNKRREMLGAFMVLDGMLEAAAVPAPGQLLKIMIICS